jgi:hypothetical protein
MPASSCSLSEKDFRARAVRSGTFDSDVDASIVEPDLDEQRPDGWWPCMGTCLLALRAAAAEHTDRMLPPITKRARIMAVNLRGLDIRSDPTIPGQVSLD